MKHNDKPPRSKGRNMTLASKITVLRIIAIPFFVIAMTEHHLLAAQIIFALSVFSDALDGTIARLRGERTPLGAFLDPLADKLLLVVSYIVFCYLNWIPLWIFVAVVSRDLLIVMGWTVVYILTHNSKIEPRPLGKITTALQMAVALARLFSASDALYHLAALRDDRLDDPFRSAITSGSATNAWEPSSDPLAGGAARAPLISSAPFRRGIGWGRSAKGIDVRQHGSGNLGATNVFRVLGWSPGLFTLVVDILKGLFPVLIAQHLFPGDMSVCPARPGTRRDRRPLLFLLCRLSRRQRNGHRGRCFSRAHAGALADQLGGVYHDRPCDAIRVARLHVKRFDFGRQFVYVFNAASFGLDGGRGRGLRRLDAQHKYPAADATERSCASNGEKNNDERNTQGTRRRPGRGIVGRHIGRALGE